ncbi:MAG: glycosyltransferase [Thermodesulfobacteriota bacterium]
MKNILFLHPNFPGQFKWIAEALAAGGEYRVCALRERAPQAARGNDTVRIFEYEPPAALRETVHRYLQGMETAVRRGQQVARACAGLRKAGFTPDIIVAHPGWGDALYLKDIFPNTPLLCFFEYYYHASGADVGFDPEFPARPDDALRLRTINALHLMMLEACDAGVCPTAWQKSLFPKAYHPKLTVAHEGINTELAKPDPAASFRMPGGPTVRAGDEVLTFVSRALEPYRGVHSFLRALPRVLAERPDCRVLIVGEEGQYYTPPPQDGISYKKRYLDEVKAGLDMKRVHFLAPLPYGQYLKVLQVSKVHAYLTYPFILSWSFLEAMSAGCCVVGARVAPVREMLADGKNGLLVDFFDHAAIAQAITAGLGDGVDRKALGAKARATMRRRLDFQRHGLRSYTKILATM